MKRKKTAHAKMCEDVMILFASLVLTEPRITPKQMKFAKRIYLKARAVVQPKEK